MLSGAFRRRQSISAQRSLRDESEVKPSSDDDKYDSDQTMTDEKSDADPKVYPKDEKPITKSDSHVVAACITCEHIVLLTSKEKHLLKDNLPVDIKKNCVNLFVPTRCASCEAAEIENIPTELYDTYKYGEAKNSISLSRVMVRGWQPYFRMLVFLDGDLSLQKTKVRVFTRFEARDMIRKPYTIQSVLLNPRHNVAAELLPHVESGFF